MLGRLNLFYNRHTEGSVTPTFMSSAISEMRYSLEKLQKTMALCMSASSCHKAKQLLRFPEKDHYCSGTEFLKWLDDIREIVCEASGIYGDYSSERRHFSKDGPVYEWMKQASALTQSMHLETQTMKVMNPQELHEFAPDRSASYISFVSESQKSGRIRIRMRDQKETLGTGWIDIGNARYFGADRPNHINVTECSSVANSALSMLFHMDKLVCLAEAATDRNMQYLHRPSPHPVSFLDQTAETVQRLYLSCLR